MARLWCAIFTVAALACTSAHADPPDAPQAIVQRARAEVLRGVKYDPSYETLAYPSGDVAPTRGACTDVVIRALRAIGVDMQRVVHEDIAAHPAAYPHITRADANIDHRRVESMRVWLERHAARLPRGTASAADRASWRPGDIVVWRFCDGCKPRHVGIVSDRPGPRGLPLVIHNIGPAAAEEDALDAWTIVGHYRVAR